MKLVHAADLHLDSPLRGLARYEGAPVGEIRAATRRALVALVDLVLRERAQGLLLAGDVVDGDWRDYNTGLFLVGELGRLHDAGIPVYLVHGNHDAASVVTRELRLPPSARTLPVAAPGTVVDESAGLAVHGQGFATRAVTENLARTYPTPVAGLVNVGLLHTSLTGRAGHAPYAPCSVDDLRARGYDYWALGHVHTREVVATDPWIVYPGNLQGRHALEAGPRGASVIDIDDATLRVRSVVHHDCDVVRWDVLRVPVPAAVGGLDAAREAALDEALCAVADALAAAADRAGGRLVAARVVLTGDDRAHPALSGDPARLQAEVRALANARGDVWVEKVLVDCPPPAPPPDAVGGDLAADLLAAVHERGADLAALRSFLRASPAHATLPTRAQHLIDTDDDALRALVARAGRRLEALLAGGRP